MNDQDLRHMLPLLDRVEEAPPKLVERLWSELEDLLDREGASTDTIPVVVGADAHDRQEWRTRGVLLAAAAVVLVVGVAVLSLVRNTPAVTDVDSSAAADVESIDAVPVTSPRASVSPDAHAETVAEACTVFRDSTAGATPLDSSGSPTLDDIKAIQIWVEGLGALLSDIDRIGLPDAATDQRLSLQLLRTALRSSIDDIQRGDIADAATALENASRHRDAAQKGDPSLSQCLAPVDR